MITSKRIMDAVQTLRTNELALEKCRNEEAELIKKCSELREQLLSVLKDEQATVLKDVDCVAVLNGYEVITVDLQDLSYNDVTLTAIPLIQYG